MRLHRDDRHTKDNRHVTTIDKADTPESHDPDLPKPEAAIPQCHAAIEILESRELLTGASASTAVLTPMIAPPAVPAEAGSANSSAEPDVECSGANEQHDAGQCQHRG